MLNLIKDVTVNVCAPLGCSALTWIAMLSCALHASQVVSQQPEVTESSSELPIGLNGERGSIEDLLVPLRSLEYQEVKTTNMPATLSLGELSKGQASWREKLESVRVTFDYTLSRVIKTPSVLERLKSGKAVSDDYGILLEFQIKGDKVYRTYKQHKSDIVDKKKTGLPVVYATYVTAFDGERMVSYESHRSIGQIYPQKLDELREHAMWYFDHLSIPTGRNAEIFRETVYYLPVALATPDLYKVQPMLELVDGFPCHVVLGPGDAIWIDDKNGYAMRRRVLFRKSNANDPGCLFQLYASRDFVEIDGIWFPKDCARIDFGTQEEPDEFRGVLKTVNRARVREIGANDVSDEVFTFQFPPGAQVIDLINNRSYYIPEGRDKLDEAIANAKPIVDGFIMPPDPAVMKPSGNVRNWFVWANVALIVILGLVFWLRRSNTGRR